VGQIGNVEKSFFASPPSSAARLSRPAQQGVEDAATERESLDGKHLITHQNRLRRSHWKRPICGRIMAVRLFGLGGAVTQHRRSRLLTKAREKAADSAPLPKSRPAQCDERDMGDAGQFGRLPA